MPLALITRAAACAFFNPASLQSAHMVVHSTQAGRAAAIAGMAAVLIAMAFTPALQRDFYVSCITLVVAVAAYLIVNRVRQPRPAPAAA